VTFFVRDSNYLMTIIELADRKQLPLQRLNERGFLRNTTSGKEERREGGRITPTYLQIKII
jgi:hypothetical protein